MGVSYETKLTLLGKALIAQAVAEESTLVIGEMSVGDGNGVAVVPSESQVSLVRERYRAAVNALGTYPANPNYIVAEMVVPATVGGWTIREVGIHTNVGDLIAVASFPATYKPILEEGSVRDLVIRIVFAVENPETLELSIDPSVSVASRQWVQDNYSLAVLLPGGTTGQILRKKSNTDGDVEWYDPASGINLLVDVIEENQSLAAAQDVVTLAIAGTAGMAVYIDGIRLRNDEYTIDSGTEFTLDVPATGGEAITIVQNEPAGSPDYLQSANKLSEIQAAGAAAQSTARGNLGLTGATFLDAIYQAVMARQYPVGEKLLTCRTGNPSTWLGFGTWERAAKGKFIAGYDETDVDFNALGKTGGEKAHRLTTNEMPPHKHQSPALGDGEVSPQRAFGSGTTAVPTLDTKGPTATAALTDSAGGNAAHNNLPPYEVWFVWLRTA